MTYGELSVCMYGREQIYVVVAFIVVVDVLFAHELSLSLSLCVYCPPYVRTAVVAGTGRWSSMDGCSGIGPYPSWGSDTAWCGSLPWASRRTTCGGGRPRQLL